MNLGEAAILGVVQGATEYLPVSSSGHLVLVPYIFGFDKGPFVFDVLVQMGTLVGVLVYFWSDLLRVAAAMIAGVRQRQPLHSPDARVGWFVGLSTIPAAAIGLKYQDDFEKAFSSPRVAMGFLLLTAVLLVVGEVFGKKHREEGTLRVRDVVVIGFAQALALFPGVSRSGSTISAGMLLGLTREGAARFSFLMSIPVMVGAGALATRKLVQDPTALAEHGAGIAVGFAVSAITGYLCIRWLLGFLKKQSLLWFAAYCALVGGVGLVVTSLSSTPG